MKNRLEFRAFLAHVDRPIIPQRVNHAVTQAGGAAGEELLLWFDIGETVGEQFDLTLFELLVLGGLVDADSGTCWFWDPARTALCFELASTSVARIPPTFHIQHQK